MSLKRVCQIWVFVVSTSSLVVAGGLQDDPARRTLRPDPGNASISGRIGLPSGSSAEFNVKVTLSNGQSTLMTLFSDKNGEFRFLNLNAGLYYVRVAADSSYYEPVTEEVLLYRGQELNVTIGLRKSNEATRKRYLPGVISVVESEQKVPSAARKEYEQATRLAHKGQLQQALIRFNKAIAIYPDYLAARNDLGAQYLKLNRLSEAAEQFEATIGINPKYFNARLNLGIVLVEQKRYTEAIDHLNVALSIDGGWPAAHLFVGVALLESNELEAAQRELAKALVLGGTGYAVAHYYMAHVFMRRGERSEAVRELETYLEAQPNGEQAAAAQTLLAKLK